MNHQQHPQYAAFAQQPVPFFSTGSYPPPSQQQQAYVYPSTSVPQQSQQQAPQQQQQQQAFRQPTPQDLHDQQQQHSPFFQTLPQGAPARPSPQQTPLQRQLSHQNQLQHSLQQQQQQRRAQNQQAFIQQDLPRTRYSVPSSPDNGPGAPGPESSSPPAHQFDAGLMNQFAQQHGQTSQGHDHGNDDDDEDDDDDGNPDDPVYQLPPPPEAIYANEVDLENAMHAWSLEHGYELVRRASKKNARGQLYKRYFHCSKHGKVSTSKKTPERNKVRVNRKSNRIGCPMSLAAVAVNPSDPSGNWQIRHRKTHHNHPAVEAIKLAGHRRRARVGGVEKAVDSLFQIGTSTSDVLKFLQSTYPEGLFNRTDVANLKLKHKNFGTCTTKRDAPGTDKVNGTAVAKTGMPTACNACRAKKRKCDSIRPSCGNCIKNKMQCVYDHSPPPTASQSTQPTNASAVQSTQQSRSQQVQSNVSRSYNNIIPPTPPQPGHSRPQNDDSSVMDLDSTADASSFMDLSQAQNLSTQNMNQRNAIDALTALRHFRQEHVNPVRLSLESSQVETLASSTCGNGDCYLSVVPRPFQLGGDWRSFKDSFHAAAVRENTNDVLSGDKKSPEKPAAEVSVEEHNEYIKQLAIFRRRNEMLKIGIKECLEPKLWSRIRNLTNAADMWRALEDMCMPRGSDSAYTKFTELHNISLSTSYNLDNFILQLETKYAEYNQTATCHESRRTITQSINTPNLERARRSNGGDGSFPEEMLCFLFLQGLGPQYQNLAKNLTRKANIGGYGTGERVGFKQLTGLVKRHFEWEASRRGASQQQLQQQQQQQQQLQQSTNAAALAR